MLHNYGMMGIVAEVLNLDYKPVSVMCKKGHHPQNVQRPIMLWVLPVRFVYRKPLASNQ
ncbi:MAG: hypothetical protein GDA48_06415 [Hormoscilla sp. GM102CHS1]|nr:hypothetical protein [Hormoscilla sp. GM102CHS1]